MHSVHILRLLFRRFRSIEYSKNGAAFRSHLPNLRLNVCRMREREFNRQQAAMMAAGHGGQASSGAASFYQCKYD